MINKKVMVLWWGPQRCEVMKGRERYRKTKMAVIGWEDDQEQEWEGI